MDTDEKIKVLEEENARLKEENARLKEELQTTKEHLKKYTAPSYKKEYYEKNKEKILERIKTNPPSSDKKKEYNRISYLRRKEKTQI